MALNATEKNFNETNIMFGDPKKYTTPATFTRIPISYKYPDGEKKLSIKTPILFSWGIQENRNQQTKHIDSYTFSFVMFDQMKGMTEEEKETIKIFNDCLKKIKEHLLKEEIKETLNKWDYDADVNRMDIFFRKKEKGKIVENLPPTLYPKLLTKFDKDRKSENPPEIVTGFYDEDDNLLDVIEDGLVHCRCKAVGAIVIDNIYLGGGRISIQLKLNDAIIMEQYKINKRLLNPLSKLKLIDTEIEKVSEDEKKEIVLIKRKPNK